MTKVVKIADIAKEIEEKVNARSCWSRGVKEWALSRLEGVEDDCETVESLDDFTDKILNGAESWEQFCEGGCALVADQDIAVLFSTPAEFRKNGGMRGPNAHETWMDVQCRAAHQAWEVMKNAYYDIANA